MPFPAPRSRKTAFRLGVVLSLLLAGGAAHAQSSAVCETRERCIDAILDAGHAGDEMRQLALMAELQARYSPVQPTRQPTPPLPKRPEETLALAAPGDRLVELVRFTGSNDAPMPEQVRALALAYLYAQRPDDAERALAAGLVVQPAHAPYWLDLAQVRLQRGRQDQAVDALVTAQTWAYDPQAMREAFRQAAQGSAAAGTRAVYAQALQRVDAGLAERARRDAAVPPPPPSGKQADDAPVPKFVPTSCWIRPDYPRASLRYLETGKVAWAFLVGADGRLQDVRKLQSSGFADLDAAAILPFASCRAKPALVDGKPVAGWMPVQYVWTLD